MAASVAHSDPPRCYFWKLPPEVRDMIYALAYDHARVINLNLREMWEREESHRRRDNYKTYTPKKFEPSPAAQLIVSKQYFDEALPYFLKSKVVQFQYWGSLFLFSGHGTMVERELLAHITSIHVVEDNVGAGCGIKGLAAFPKLRALSINIGEDYLVQQDRKLGRERAMSDAMILQSEYIRAFTGVRGLRQVCFRRTMPYGLDDPDDIAILAGNLDRAEAIIRGQVLRQCVAKPSFEYPVGIEKALKREDHWRSPPKADGLASEARQPSAMHLQDVDVPDTSDAVVQLFLDRPQDVVAWMKDAKARLATVPTGT